MSRKILHITDFPKAGDLAFVLDDFGNAESGIIMAVKNEYSRLELSNGIVAEYDYISSYRIRPQVHSSLLRFCREMIVPLREESIILLKKIKRLVGALLQSIRVFLEIFSF